MDNLSERIAERVISIPDHPVKGVIFRDITPIAADAELFRDIIHELAFRHKDHKIDRVLGIESRGFIFGAALAQKLGCGFTPIRKAGKLPRETIQEKYALEYGEGVIEIQKDAFEPGCRAILVDDLLATGGTINAALRLAKRLGAEVLSVDFVIELGFLSPRSNIQECPDINTLLTYQ